LITSDAQVEATSTATTRSALILVANARMPSERAQSLQIAHAAAAFARQGQATELLYARRTHTPSLPAGEDLWSYYGVPNGERPGARALGCIDWIDRVPRALQFVPARLQEWSFARAAAAAVRAASADTFVLTRELETAHALRGRARLFLEIHRVPGGKLRRRLLAEAAQAAAGVLAISGGVRADLVELGVEAAQLRVEHDGFEPALFPAALDRSMARAELGIDDERPLVVYTGGLLAWKGVDVLVEAARALSDVQFVIAGGMQADVERSKRLAAGLEHVRFDGFQPPARVASYLSAADLAVVPNRSTPAISARYTSPLKVFEAMAYGTPLVVSDLPSLRDILSEDEALFVAPDDARALAQGVRTLLDDPGRRARLGRALAARAPEHTWDARAQRILAWMKERA